MIPTLPQGVTNGWLVALWLVLACATPIILAFVARWGHRKLSNVEEQVTNSHDTNLREDIDKIAKQVTDLTISLNAGVGGLHSNIHELRDETADLRRALRRHFPDDPV